MTRSEMATELARIRFTSSTVNDALVLNWLAVAETAVWNAAPWEFKRVPAANLTVTNGAATEPADFGKAIRLYTPRGDELYYMDPDDFERDYVAAVPVPTGVATAYTVIDRQILVGPQESGTFKLSYRRRVTHRNTGGTPVAGVMSTGTDTPYWDSEHHYIVVAWALRLGETLHADPAAARMDAVIDELRQGWLFRSMYSDLVGGVEQQVEMWGAPC